MRQTYMCCLQTCVCVCVCRQQHMFVPQGRERKNVFIFYTTHEHAESSNKESDGLGSLYARSL